MRLFYQIITAVFQPLFICTFGIIWLMTLPPYEFVSIQYKLQAIFGTAIITGILPAIPILIMLFRGKLSDVFISDKKERTIPYLISMLAYVLWSFYLSNVLLFPAFISVIGIASAMSVLIMMIINFKWKISAHLCSVGGMSAFVVGTSYIFAINPTAMLIGTFAVSAIVGLSRVELKAHTPAQAFFGYLVGFFCILISISISILFGY